MYEMLMRMQRMICGSSSGVGDLGVIKYNTTRMIQMIQMMVVMMMGNIVSGATQALVVRIPPDANGPGYSGGFPGAEIRSASATGASLAGGHLVLDSDGTGIAYALFPYVPFNASNPRTGSFNTVFKFTLRSIESSSSSSSSSSSISPGLGFIALDPGPLDSAIEARLRSIARREYLASNTSAALVRESSYVAIVSTAIAGMNYSTVRMGSEPVASFDVPTITGDDSMLFQYVDPASLPPACPNDTLRSSQSGASSDSSSSAACPSNYASLARSGMMFGINLRSNFSLHPVPQLIGFFAFGGAAVDVSSWKFTSFYITGSSTNSSATSDGASGDVGNVVVGTTATILPLSGTASTASMPIIIRACLLITLLFDHLRLLPPLI